MLEEGQDPDEVARARAMERAEVYVGSRAGCTDCHGEDLGGAVVADDPLLGRWVAPNITTAGKTADYTPSDWSRIVRHGVKPGGKVVTMPAQDWSHFSDQEISDLIVFIEAQPPVDREMPSIEYGPIFTMMLANGTFPIHAETIDHMAPRPKLPPSRETRSLELGKHIALTCTGCHGPGYSGGPVPGGDPGWPPGSNLTPDESGIAHYDLASFTTVMRDGSRPDGTHLHEAMPIAYTSRMNDTEIESLWDYLNTLDPRPFGGR